MNFTWNIIIFVLFLWHAFCIKELECFAPILAESQESKGIISELIKARDQGELLAGNFDFSGASIFSKMFSEVFRRKDALSLGRYYATA